jgi:DNA-binding NtrC family response regulator
VAVHTREKILVVEDDAEMRKFASETLRLEWYDVLEAGGSGQALETLGRCDALHLVVTDVVLQDADGMELGAMLHELQPNLPVLYISGHPENEVVKQISSLPDVEFLQKPFEPAILQERVRGMLGRLRVVVADDDEGMRMMWREVLERAGYEVSVCGDGSAAVREVRAKKTDLLILDLVMPKQEGLETLLQMKNEKVRVKVLAVSGYAHGEYLRFAKLFGAENTLLKPVEPARLLAKVEELIGVPVKRGGKAA